ncbi:hypothetical protein QR46_4263 [Giardia duodenalis assemblage B]|uniref:Uncharacterized protein n=1 Tax=Giardia duodenalis assemblage B TaxID=1394984 RepID=A0A132NNW0_GIAIN|nr:hypothetical protein QR46_4263 [Giardia intestinalis assemblage B]
MLIFITYKYKTMIQAESAEEVYATFVKIRKVDSKNLSWFVKYLKMYKLIYRRYVKSLRSLLLKMRRAPMLTETTAASENNIYKSILSTVNVAEEHTRLVETDFSLIRDAVGAYLRRLSQLQKTYKAILALQKQGENDGGSGGRTSNQAEINERKDGWKQSVYESFKVRMKIYAKVKTIKLEFDFTKGAAPDKADKQPSDHPTVEEQRPLSGGPNCDCSLIFPDAAADPSGTLPSFYAAAHFEPNYSVATRHSS